MNKGKWSSNLVSVIVVSSKNSQSFWDLLSSLDRQTYKHIEKTIVLNNFPKEEKEHLERSFPNIRVIDNRDNLFYCKANNQGIQLARGEFVLCLNDDLILENGFIEEMVRAAKKDKKIGMVAGCIMRPDKKTIDTTGLFLAKSRRPVERGYGRLQNDLYKEAEYVFGAGGVAPLFRRNMLEDIKIGREYFDEAYDMFYEDLDISWRANNRGWKGYYTPFALAYHERGKTAKQREPKFAFLRKYNFAWLPNELKISLLRNRYMTIIKNDIPVRFLLHLPWVLLYDVKVWLYLILFEPRAIGKFLKDWSFVSSAWQRRRQISGAFRYT